jgi:hypothetical protein
MYVYVYVYVRVHVHVNVYVYVYVHVHVNANVNVKVDVNVYVYVDVWMLSSHVMIFDRLCDMLRPDYGIGACAKNNEIVRSNGISRTSSRIFCGFSLHPFFRLP